MNEKSIITELEKITEKGEKRKQEALKAYSCNDAPGDAFYYLTESERERRHELLMMLPSFSAKALAAKQRIKERISKRKQERKNSVVIL